MKKLITILVSFLMLFTVVVPVAAEGEATSATGETTTSKAPSKKYAPAFVAEVDSNGDLYIKSDDKDWLNAIHSVKVILTNGSVVTSAEEASKKNGNMYLLTNYLSSEETELTKTVSGGPYPAFDGRDAYNRVVSGVPQNNSDVFHEPDDYDNSYKPTTNITFDYYADFVVDSENGYLKISKDMLKRYGVTSGKFVIYVGASGYYWGCQNNVEFDYIAPRPRQVETGQNLQLTVGTSKNVTWSSSNEKYATVDENGYVTFKHPSDVTITASIDGKVVDTYTVNCSAPKIELSVTQDETGNVYIRLDDKELMKNIASPYTRDENGDVTSEGGYLMINGTYIGNRVNKQYDQTDIYYEYIEDGSDAYLFVPVKTILAKGVPAGTGINVNAGENVTGIYKNLQGVIDLNIGCKPYPSDATVAENGTGDIIIRSSDKEFLEKLVSIRGTYTDDDFFGIELEVPGREGSFRMFDNYSSSNKILTLEKDSSGEYFVLLKNATLLNNNYTNGEYKYHLKAYGYAQIPHGKEGTITITHGIKDFENEITVVDEGDKIVVKVNGDNSEDWISKLVKGREDIKDEELGYYVTTNDAMISLSLTKDGTTYNGGIYNYAFYEADGITSNDKKLDYIIDNGDGTLTISKSNLKHGFVDGTYDFTFKVNGYADVTVNGVNLSFGVVLDPVLYTDFKIEGNITPIVGSSTDAELNGVKITALNAKGERVDITDEVSMRWTEEYKSPYGDTYYGPTSDDKFVSGKVYYLGLSYTYQWKGDDRTTVSTIEYNGVKYSSEYNFMGAAPGSYMDTLDLKQFFIKQTVGTMTKINVPAAKTGLVYNGKAQTGVDTSKYYTVTNNTATDAGEYTATVKPNPGYCWNDGTQVEKEVKFTIAKANPTGYSKPNVTAIYGQKLSEIDIDEAGEWSWVAPTTVINGVGNKTYSAKYTPKDYKNYNSVLDTLTVKVAPKPVTEDDIKVPAASEITYGDKLSASKLTETGWTWTDSSLVLTVKNDGAKVQYKVADDVNYDYSKIEGYDAKTHLITRTITVTVKKADPADKTPELKAIYGQLLADITLPEGWKFVSATGTSVGDAGVKGIEVTFTPKDTDNYNVVTREAMLTVAKAKPNYTVLEIKDSVVEGTKLSEVSLENFNGWSWKNPNQEVGDNNIAVFTPEDTKNYLTVEANVKIAVKHEIQITEDIKANVEIKSGVEDKTESTVENKKTEEVKVENNALTETVKDIVINATTESKLNTEIKDKEKVQEIQEAVKKAVEEDKSISVETVITKEEKKIEDVSKEEKKAVENKISSNDKVESYLDLNVNLKVKVDGGSEISTAVSKLANPVKLTISIKLPADIDKQKYEYFIVVIHDGKEPYTIKADLDKDNSSVSFDAQEFSTYALVSRKVVNNPGGSSSSGSSSGNDGYKAPNTKA